MNDTRVGRWFDPTEQQEYRVFAVDEGTVGGVQYVTVLDEDSNPIDYNVRMARAREEYGMRDITEPLPCGCIPHRTRMSGFGTALYCETEENAYCNFECPHEEEE